MAGLAAQYGALTVDFYDSAIFSDPSTLIEDGNHPNPAGYDLVAELWFEVLRPILE
jgi:lysophospholipase L1-like esterase